MSIEKKFLEELECIPEFDGVHNVLIDLKEKQITIVYHDEKISKMDKTIIESTEKFFNEERTDIGYKVVLNSVKW